MRQMMRHHCLRSQTELAQDLEEIPHEKQISFVQDALAYNQFKKCMSIWKEEWREEYRNHNHVQKAREADKVRKNQER